MENQSERAGRRIEGGRESVGSGIEVVSRDYLACRSLRGDVRPLNGPILMQQCRWEQCDRANEEKEEEEEAARREILPRNEKKEKKKNGRREVTRGSKSDSESGNLGERRVKRNLANVELPGLGKTREIREKVLLLLLLLPGREPGGTNRLFRPRSGEQPRSAIY